MKFKTVIKLVSDAKDKADALDVVEEYLAGNITSGVEMKCVTKAVCSKAKIAGFAALSLVVLVGIFAGSHIRHSQNMFQTGPCVSAVQPPLGTSNVAHKTSKFKREWTDRQTQEALATITR